MVRSCAACRYRYDSANSITLHSFPKDPKAREKWRDITRQLRGGDNYEPLKNSAICSQHFDLSNYQYNKYVDKWILQPGAMPAVHPSNPRDGPPPSELERVTAEAAKAIKARKDAGEESDEVVEAEEEEVIQDLSAVDVHMVNLTDPEAGTSQVVTVGAEQEVVISTDRIPHFQSVEKSQERAEFLKKQIRNLKIDIIKEKAISDKLKSCIRETNAEIKEHKRYCYCNNKDAAPVLRELCERNSMNHVKMEKGQKHATTQQYSDELLDVACIIIRLGLKNYDKIRHAFGKALPSQKYMIKLKHDRGIKSLYQEAEEAKLKKKAREEKAAGGGGEVSQIKVRPSPAKKRKREENDAEEAARILQEHATQELITAEVVTEEEVGQVVETQTQYIIPSGYVTTTQYVYGASQGYGGTPVTQAYIQYQ